MKTTSIVFIIIAVLLMIGGAITCAVAGNIADTDGYILFENLDSGYAMRDFSNSAATKMSISVTDAEVYIYGGAESSYFEVIHFREDLYTLTTVGTTLLFEERVSFTSFFDFSRGFSFSGIRNLFRGSDTETGTRQVNIYLSENTENLKQINITAKNCKIFADNISNHCDITVEATGDATLRVSNVRTNAVLSVTAGRAQMNMENSVLHTLYLTAEQADASANNIVFKKIDLTANTGNISVTTPARLDGCNMVISAGTGEVNIGGFDMPRPHKTAHENAPCEIRFTSDAATLTVSTAEA